MDSPLSPAGRAAVAQVVYEAITTILPGLTADQIKEHHRLNDLGADSVDRVEIIVAAVERLGVTEPLSVFGSQPDLHSLIDRLTLASRA